ncbi:SPOR domain-containing protein [Paenibacillus sp. Aloe-11]|uniref:SPOR domain-containing protein n=1 Tax=Paenibacillus sp. Aloe-11 TaxID=1050222 RepID=UPI00024F0675|nr:SPOR domain-containing protein [Paenibacillus sp. Aloe-11]EHS57629.1 hypothetical protein WG8_2585 [Paenibacillus sp. Aloe-11]
MNGKEHYDNIEIPARLSEVIQHVRHRAQHQKRKKMFWRGCSLLAVCAAMMITINMPGVAQALSDVPVIGPVVKILQVGNGGKPNDGVLLTTSKEADTLNIYFQLEGEHLASAPAYTLDHQVGPNRLIFTFNGVRELDYAKLEKDIKALKNVKDAYRNIILDDSAIRFVVELKDDVDYSVSEYRQPGFIQLKLFSTPKNAEAHRLFFVRSQEMEQDETLALLAEQYNSDGSSIVKTQNGKFAMVIGGFENQTEAEKLLQQIASREEHVQQLFVDSWMSNENPK